MIEGCKGKCPYGNIVVGCVEKLTSDFLKVLKYDDFKSSSLDDGFKDDMEDYNRVLAGLISCRPNESYIGLRHCSQCPYQNERDPDDEDACMRKLIDDSIIVLERYHPDK